MNTLKRIIIADDHAVVRTGLQLMLDETSDLLLCGEASTGQELLDKLSIEVFDMVVLDISMPGKDAMDVLKEIKDRWPQTAVAIFSMNPDEAHAVRMFRNGASAYINKQTQPKQIIEALRVVASGRKYFFPHQAELFSEMFTSSTSGNEDIHEALTDREFQVFLLLAHGKRKTEISNKLTISKNTVSNHRNNILRKMGFNTNAELTRYAIQKGFIK